MARCYPPPPPVSAPHLPINPLPDAPNANARDARRMPNVSHAPHASSAVHSAPLVLHDPYTPCSSHPLMPPCQGVKRGQNVHMVRAVCP